jgi:hypothetical protein
MQNVEDLMGLVTQIVPYHMSHNAEPEAVDLLLEVRERVGPEAGGNVTGRVELRREQGMRQRWGLRSL